MSNEKVYSLEEIEKYLESKLPNWYYENGWIRRKYKTSGWKGTLMVINTIGHLAEAAWHHPDLSASYAFVIVKLQNHAAKGITDKELVFNAVNSRKNTGGKYNNDGQYIGEEFLGYVLTQSLQIDSNEVEKVESISREITELLNEGVQFYSESPRYYYTKLSDLKIEMISKATEDAKLRAEKISEFSGGKLGKLESARMGIFQITGQNSKENYSWGGTFNTSSREKTASITMKLTYKVD